MTTVLPRTSAARRRGHLLATAGAAGALLAAAVVTSTSIGALAAIAVCGLLCCRWPVDRLILAYLAVSLRADERSAIPFNQLWESPVQHAADFWFETVKHSVPWLPIPASPMFLVAVGLLARTALERTGPGWARDADRPPLPASFRSALRVAVVALAASCADGLVRGGDVQQTYYQIFGLVVAVALAAATAAVGSPELGRSVCTLVVALAGYRAALAAWVYLTKVVGHGPPPLYVTTHADSALWAVALAILFARFIEQPTRRHRSMLLLVGTILGFALVVNNRRLGWVVVATAFAYVTVMSHGVARRRLTRLLSYVALPLVLYVAVALVGPEKRIFAPVQALRSVVRGTDTSSVTRDVENFNLVFTLRAHLPIGTGFGHPYIEAIRGADISTGVGSSFVNYRYLPHNSLLGLLMWMGPVGLALVLLPLLVGVRAALAAHRTHADPAVRVQVAAVLTAWVGYVMSAWGDQGLYGGATVVLGGVFAGLGVRLAARDRSMAVAQE